MKNKLLLVNPYIGGNKYPPLSLISLASFIEQYSYQVDILDANALELTSEETIDHIIQSNADFCGFTFMTPQADYVVNTIKKIKSVQPDMILLAGGVHVSIVPEDFLTKCPEIDYVVVGEGELTLLELLNTLRNGNCVDDILGIGYFDNNKIRINSRRSLIKDLDELPIPAWNKLPIDKYEVVTPERVSKATAGLGLTVSSERGCPFQCTFCASGSVFGRSYRSRSPQKIVDEVRYLVECHSISNFFFVDEVLTYKDNTILELCSLLLSSNLNIKWSCNSRCNAHGLNESTISVMKQAGCMRLDFGVESGSPNVLKSIKKGITLKDVYNSHKIVHKAGLFTTTLMMVGQPDETLDDFKRSLKMVLYLESEVTSFGPATPFPGTQLYDYAIKNNKLRIESNNWSEFYIGNKRHIFKTNNFDYNQVTDLANYANSVCSILTKLSDYKRHRIVSVVATFKIFMTLLIDFKSSLPISHRYRWIMLFLLKRNGEDLVDKAIEKIKIRNLSHDCNSEQLHNSNLISELLNKNTLPHILIVSDSTYLIKQLIDALKYNHQDNISISHLSNNIQKAYTNIMQHTYINRSAKSCTHDAVFFLVNNKDMKVIIRTLFTAVYFKIFGEAKRLFLITASHKYWEINASTIFNFIKCFKAEICYMLLLPISITWLMYTSYKTKELSSLEKIFPSDSLD